MTDYRYCSCGCVEEGVRIVWCGTCQRSVCIRCYLQLRRYSNDTEYECTLCADKWNHEMVGRIV